MYETITYESILQRMLSKVPASLDRREGSVIYDALAPAAVEMQNLYIELDGVLNETFADTASRDNLVKRAAERGLAPYEATRAVLKGVFNIEVPIGSRFRLDNLYYVVTEQTASGEYKVECQTAGKAGNHHTGILIPVEYMEGLTKAELTELLIPGEDAEDTEQFRKRYFQSLDAEAFGGNVADYREKVKAMKGVGGVKVHRAWNGGIEPSSLITPAEFDQWYSGLANIPEPVDRWLKNVSKAGVEGQLTVGGTVRLTIISSDGTAPTETLINSVREQVDPDGNHGTGLGMAPVGHFVTVKGVEERTIEIETEIAYHQGWKWEDVKPHLEAAVNAYFQELASTWAEQDEPLIVRISQIETRFLNVSGVMDLFHTKINGSAANLTLEADCIPVRGEING